MKTRTRILTSLGILAASLAAGTASAMVHPDMVGTAIRGMAADRVIAISPSTRWVNVAYGETVRLLVNGGGQEHSLVFRFDGFADKANLSDIAQAPLGIDVPIYVDQSRNPLARAVTD
jgi:hypothetical protein